MIPALRKFEMLKVLVIVAACSVFVCTAKAQNYSISGAISPASSGSGATVTLTGSAPVLVQTARASSSSGTSSVTASFPSANLAGDTVLVFLRFGGTTVSSVTDNQSGGTNTYASVVGPTQWGVAPDPTDRWAQVFLAKNIIGGTPLDITVSFAGASTRDVYAVAVEYSGVDPANPVNAVAVGTGSVGANGAPKTPNLTTTVGNTKLVATSWDSNESYTATGNGTGYTTNTAAGVSSLSGGAGWANLTEDTTASSAGSWNATASSAPAVADWAIQVVALKPAASLSVTADSSGNFVFGNVPNGSYTVTPSSSGITFTPSSQSVTVNGANVTGVNFTATSPNQTYSISGTLSPASSGSGATVTLTGGVPVLVQSAPGAATPGASSVSVSFGGSNAPGDTIVLFARYGGATISSVTDNQPGGSNTYSSVIGPTQWGVAPNSTDRLAQVFVAKNIKGGSPLTITVSLAGSSTHDTYLAALEYSGVDTANPVSASAQGTGTVSINGAPSTSNLTTTVANSKLVATSWDSNESYTATGNGSGYTTDTAAGIHSLSGGSGWPNLTEDRTATTTGNWNATASSSPAVVDWAIQLVALKPASSRTVTADSSGNYSFTGVANGTYTLTPTNSGVTFTPANQTVTVNNGDLTGIDFTATGSAGTISGKVTNSSGTGIANATVSYSGGATTATTDSAGNYSLSVAPGTYSVTATATGYQSSTQQNITVTSGTTTPLNFTLTQSSGAIAGKVTNSSGTGIANATVSYSGGSTTATTDSTGNYSLSVAPGTYSVTATATGYQSSTQQNIAVTSGTTTPLNFTLTQSSGSIAGKVTNSSGTGIANATVTYSGGSTTATTDSAGNYSLSVAPGTYSVTATATGYQSSTQQNIAVTSGTTTPLNFTLTQSSGAIAGKVTNSSGTGIANATVSYSGGSTTATTDSTGNYSLSIAPGTYSVTATATGFKSSTQQNITVTSGTTTPLNFTLTQSSGAIAGKVTNSSGTGIANATVSYSGGSTTATTDSAGNYSLSVAPGTYSVTATATGFNSSTQSVAVTGGVATAANFSLSPFSGAIAGTVTSLSGKPIAGATVAIVGGVVATNLSLSTNSRGRYSSGAVPVGSYQITVTKGSTRQQKAASVTANTTKTVNFTIGR